jgi:hypothetical protein
MRGLTCCLIAVLFGVSACGEIRADKEADGGVTPDAPGGCTGTTVACGTDNALYQCDENSGSLTKVQDCQYGCTSDHCNECAADTTFCNGDDLVMCDGSGTIVNPMTCANGCQGDHCNTCKPGVSYCDGSGNAVTCGLDGMPGTPMACGSAGCISGVCNTCQPSTVSCQGDTLVSCAANGTVQGTTACTFGCGVTPNAHCKVFQPSYVGTTPTGTLPDLVIDSNAVLDITGCPNGSVGLSKGGVGTTLVSPQVANVVQSGGTPICVVRFGKITVMAGFTLNVVNDYATGNVLSLEATDDVSIAGTITFTNSHNGPVPGASSTISSGGGSSVSPGAGGGGGARSGGTGGPCTSGCSTSAAGSSGGAAITNITTVLKPGSHGGAITNGMFVYGGGGSGGGAIHLVSMTRVNVASTGKIVLNGAGAIGNVNIRSLGAGGGSGGTLVIEAPNVSFSAGALAVANGGGGAGGCPVCVGDFIPTCTNADGENGQISATRAAGGNCNGAGNGGWEANGDLSPAANGNAANGASAIGGGGGGGSSGFIFLRGRSAANVTIATGAIVSPQPTLGAVTAN